MKQIQPVHIQARRPTIDFDRDDQKNHPSFFAPTRCTVLGEARRQMIESWQNIDDLLIQICHTSKKSEKTRLLNMIGAQRARIFIRMGLLIDKIDLSPFKTRSKYLFALLESLMDTVQRMKLRQALLLHFKRNEASSIDGRFRQSKILAKAQLTELMY